MKYELTWQKRSRRRHQIAMALIIALFSMVVLVTHQYSYGSGDHAIVIPFVKEASNPTLYPDDYLIAQKPYFYTYFWDFLGLLARYLHLDLPPLFFIGYFLAVYLSFWGFWLLATTLFEKQEVAVLTLFFLLFPRQGLGGVRTLERFLYTRVAALPILLFAFYFFFKKRYELAFVFLGIGFLIHPLSAAYVIAMLTISALFHFKEIGFKRGIICLCLLILPILPLLIKKILHTPPSLNGFWADPQWIELLRMRESSSDHLFPLSWSRELFFRAGLMLVLFFISWKHKPRDFYHHTIIASSLTIIALCFVGTIFVEFFPTTSVIQFQFFRSFRFLTYFTILYFANYFFREIAEKKNIFDKMAVGILGIGILYNARNWEQAYTVLLIFTAGYTCYYLKTHKNLLLKYSIMLFVGFVLVAGMYGTYKRGFIRFTNEQSQEWLDVQLWAKHSTDQQDIFIVPPNSGGFRVESERTIYGDWGDGTQMFFNPAFGKEWIRRMHRLGCEDESCLEDIEGFLGLKEAEISAIAAEFPHEDRHIFFVTFRTRDHLNFPVVYKNNEFLVYQITAPIESTIKG